MEMSEDTQIKIQERPFLELQNDTSPDGSKYVALLWHGKEENQDCNSASVWNDDPVKLLESVKFMADALINHIKEKQ